MKHILSLAALSSATLAINSCVHQAAPSALTINEAANHSQLHISAVHANVSVRGRIAETTLSITFYNDSDRTLEAKVDLPLPEGATITGYALEVNGNMRDGVLVDKELGRVAFENTIRQNIDPGLLEKTAGNNFRTRIYPILPKGSKKLKLTYIEPLHNKDGSLAYSLPIDFKKGVDKFSLNLDVDPSSIVSNLRGSKKLSQGDYKRTTSSHRSNSPYTLYLNQELKTSAFSSKGRDGRTYFYLAHNNDPTKVSQTRPIPKRIQLVWDASHSGSKRDKKAELKLLETYFKQLGNTTVDLKIISNTLTHAGSFTIKNGSSSSLIKALVVTHFDGSSRLDLIDFGQTKYDATIYIGDGMQITEASEPKVGKTPIHVIHSGSEANFPWLRSLTRRTGGAFAKTKNNLAINALLKQQERLIKVSGSGVSKTHIISRSDHQQAVGSVSSSTTRLTLHFGRGNTITRRQTITLKREPSSSHAPSQLWAQQEIDKLSITPKKNRPSIVSLSQKHRVVSDFTSLIVLDRLADYLRYRIVPPTAKMRKEYYKNLKSTPAYKKQESADLNKIHTNWQVFDHHFKNKAVPLKLQKKQTSHSIDWLLNDLLNNVDQAWEVPSAPIFLGGGNIGNGVSRNATNFSNTAIQGIASSGDVFNTPTSGLRSGDTAITRDSINFFLNNPTRTAASATVNPGILSLPGHMPRSNYDETRTHLLSEIPEGAKPLVKVAKADPPTSARFALRNQIIDTKYMLALNDTSDEKEALRVYFKWKKKRGAQAGFYVDCSRFFFQRGYTNSAKRVLSSLAEIDSQSAAMLRILAHGYMQIGEPSLALPYYRKVKELRAEEPQSYRDLALALTVIGQNQAAADLYWTVISKKWDSRFDGIELIALHEWNHLVAKHRKFISLKASQKRFVQSTKTDMRVAITWDTDNSDMDLWVTDPNGVKVYYANRFTANSGVLSKDLTQGRGPEEFLLHRAQKGAYKIQVDYFGTREQTLYGSTTLHVDVTTHWGKPNESTQHRTIRLSGKARTVNVGKVIWK